MVDIVKTEIFVLSLADMYIVAELMLCQYTIQDIVRSFLFISKCVKGLSINDTGTPRNILNITFSLSNYCLCIKVLMTL